LVVGWALNPRGFPKCFFGAGQGAKAANELGSFLCPGVPDGRVRACAPIDSAIFFVLMLRPCLGMVKSLVQGNKLKLTLRKGIFILP
jgi:hypothetical protein